MTPAVERERLARERTTLRRLGILAARAEPSVVFTAMAQEMARIVDPITGASHPQMAAIVRFDGDELVVLSAWGAAEGVPVEVGSRWPLTGDSVTARVARTGRPAWADGYREPSSPITERAAALGTRSSVGVPIFVEGELWGGATVLSSHEEPLPPDTEHRLTEFAELVSTAIVNAATREQARQLAQEQAALRRVATLVAQGGEPGALFAAVTAEVGRLLDADAAGLLRFEDDERVSALSHWAATGEPVSFEERYPLVPGSLSHAVAHSGRSVRIDGWDGVAGGIGTFARDVLRSRHGVGSPILVDGRLWGVLTFHSAREGPPPDDIEPRLETFAQLVATAISNAETQTRLQTLALEQGALRRVATLVAQGIDPIEVARSVTAELLRLPAIDRSTTVRFEADETFCVVACHIHAGEDEGVIGEVWALGQGGVSSRIARTGAPVRIDDWVPEQGEFAEHARARLGLRGSVGCPIVVDGDLWGTLLVHTHGEDPLPAPTETRIASFAELIATALSNARAHADVRRLADEQAALRRVATLVARQASAEELFTTVVEEIGAVLGTDDARMLRYGDDGTVTVLASWGALRDRLPVGLVAPIEGYNVTTLVYRTGLPARIDDYAGADGALSDMVVPYGLRSAVGCPVVVAGRLWGLTVAATVRDEPLPPGIEQRMMEFTGLVATAIANIEARAALDASRSRIVTAADDARRRVERDLHDGAQQRLVSLALQVRAAEAMTPPDLADVRGALHDVADGLTWVLDELRELSRGIHPAVLSEAGLAAALRALGRRASLPVEIVDRLGRRLDEGIEVTAYYVVSEALANTTKHAGASRVTVTVTALDEALDIVVADDGVGGADPAKGSGLLGLIDRVEARGGSLSTVSPAGEGTTLRVRLPLAPARSARSIYRQAGGQDGG